MSKNPPITKLLTKASNLKQKDETWEATVRLGRFWITPHRQPAYRPHITLL
ncbi:MAG: hypothetical protein HC857_15145, partial [Synechococcales cyanobacterium RU_4_20]|nr:hypothetical protein [Synechococcales cyanobacterium RU_4_20]